jgi:hypothetical protein
LTAHAALEAVAVFVPVLGAFVVHAPVMRWDLLPAWKRPLDAGAVWRGRRVFGDNKTWRGAAAMAAGVVLAALLLRPVDAWWTRLPEPIRAAGVLPYATLLALGTVAAELPNSFVKRRLDVAPGARRRSPLGVLLVVLEQGDFVLGGWLALAPLWAMNVAQAALAFVVVVAVHAALNVVGWAVGARDVPM